MSRPLRTLLLFCVAALLVAGLAAQPAMAKKKEACWRTLINDWYDGVIDDKYKLHCYREALDRLGDMPDLNNYSTAREDINRAYQARIVEIRKERNKRKGTKTPEKPGQGDKSEIPVVTPTPPPAPPPSSETPSIPTPPPPTPATDPPTPATGVGPKPTPQATETGPKVVRLPASPQPQPTTQPGRQTPDGPIPAAIGKLGPDEADSLPIPLLVLGGLALLLMLGGALGFVTRRMQSRRMPPMQPATARADTRRR